MAAIYSVSTKHPEWDRMWAGLIAATGDADASAEDKCTGEVWQYMGTVAIDGTLVHQFRHRSHPTTGTRRYVNVPASAGWRA